VGKPEEYREFSPNIRDIKVQRYKDAGGVVDYTAKLDLRIVSLHANHRLTPAPDGGLLLTDRSPNDGTNYRYQFLAVPGGTLLVMYGFTDTGANGVVRSVVTAAP